MRFDPMPERAAMSALDDSAGGALVGSKRKGMMPGTEAISLEGVEEFAPPPAGMARATEIDKAKCLVTAIVCTDAIDTYGDIVEPSGALLEFHKANPVCLYQHGLGLGGAGSPGYIYPVARWELDDGTYTIEHVGDMLIGKARFVESDRMSA